VTSLTDIRCFHHRQREAVARCAGCRHFFCRECIADHNGQMLCAACLRAGRRRTSSSGSAWWALCKSCLYAAAGLMLAWLVFTLLANVLLRIPTTFHEGHFQP